MGVMSSFIEQKNKIENNRMFLEKLKISLVRNEENVVLNMAKQGINTITLKEYQEIILMALNYGRVNSLKILLEQRKDLPSLKQLIQNIVLACLNKGYTDIVVGLKSQLSLEQVKEIKQNLINNGSNLSKFESIFELPAKRQVI
jgi:hypothetical protein